MTDFHVTEAVFTQLGAIVGRRPEAAMLRVAVLGGGCSGFHYSFELADQAEPGDTIVEQDGLQVLVDPVSLPFLDGATIDYRNELIGSRFTVENPNARSTCGCGTSFSV